MRRKAVYVAGPITSGNPFENMLSALAVGQELIEAGFAPYVPHLTVYWDKLHNPGENTWETWLEIDLPWVSKADAVLRLPGESPGADREVALAYKLGIPVYSSVPNLLAGTREIQRYWPSEAKEPRPHFVSSKPAGGTPAPKAKETREVTREDIERSLDHKIARMAKEPEKPVSAKTEFQTDTQEYIGKNRAPTEGATITATGDGRIGPSYLWGTKDGEEYGTVRGVPYVGPLDVHLLPESIRSVITKIVDTFQSKNADYAADKDGWRSNFDDIARQCGIPATEAANTLIAVKQARLRALQANGRAPANEAVEDTLLDRAVYSVLALALWQEDNA